MLRGFHSKRSSSTASRTAATGDAKVADIPPAAPATSRVFRSALVSLKNWASIEPKAPPCHDDRAFRPEGAAGADRNGSGERLQEGDPRLHPAPPDEDGLEGFR